mmetsp:Transcript_37436/g.38856  ORF Transcript_37436/g.38856 Transcript_37436/m.38856 type:complete len:243 (+) Transcript_37436:132-860(+)
MAKSKRNRTVELTKTKKVADKKDKYIEKIRSHIKEYQYVYSFAFKNISTLAMQSLRHYFKSQDDSTFILGKATLMQVALGKNEEESYAPNSYLLSTNLRGNCGLFFSNKDPSSVIPYFEEYNCPYFTSPGSISTQTHIIKSGCPAELKRFPSSMENQFREIGLKNKLDGGKWYVLEDFVVCQEGKKVTPEQARMMRILDLKLDEFRIHITGYSSKDGESKLYENKLIGDSNTDLFNDVVISN